MGLVRTKVAKICEMLLQKTLFSHLFSSLQLEYRWIVALRFWKYPYTPSFLFSTVTSVTSISVNLQVFVNQWNGSIWWVAIPPISITLLSHCCHTIITLLSHYYHITSHYYHVAVTLPHTTITLLSHYYYITVTLPHTTIILLSPCCHTTIILLSLKPFLLKKSISHPNNWLISSEKSHISSKMSLVSPKLSLVFPKKSLVFPKMSLVFWKKWHIIKEGSHFIAQLCDRCDSKKHKTPGIYARAYAWGE